MEWFLPQPNQETYHVFTTQAELNNTTQADVDLVADHAENILTEK